MPSRETVERFVAMVVSGKHDQAIADFYMPDATMQENLTPPRKGRDGLVAREQATMAAFAEIHTTCVPPVLIAGDTVVVHWIFEFVKADGGRFTIEELAHQRWDGDKIAEERFYYDPGQFKPAS
ncbi:MAG TPA: nuclear transport factor 2 family protein [Rhizomicrobium sp.]|jgi:ketosteroid isomerase-like protein